MDDRLTCPVCQRQLRSITTQHIRTHGYATASEFKAAFGLEHLKCPSMRAKQSRFMAVNSPTQGGHSEEALGRMSRNRKGKGIGVAGKYERTPEIRAQISRGVAKAHREGRIRGRGQWVWSDTHCQDLWVRSSWEARVVKVLDNHPCVEWYEYEPFVLPYLFDGHQRNYIPDFMVSLEGSITEVWEVKPHAWWEHPVNAAKWEALVSYCSGQGYNTLMVDMSRLEGMERQVGLLPWEGVGGPWVDPEDPSFRPRSPLEQQGFKDPAFA